MDNWISAIDGKRIGRVSGPGAHAVSAVSLKEVRYAQQLQIGTWPSALNDFIAFLENGLAVPVPRRTGFSAAQEGRVVLAMAPGKWMYLARGAAQECTFPALRADQGVVTDVSHTFTCLSLSGPAAVTVLGKGAAIDFRRSFGIGSVTRTVIHAMGVTIWHRDRDTYELFVYTSFAQSLFDWIVDAGEEFGCNIGELQVID